MKRVGVLLVVFVVVAAVSSAQGTRDLNGSSITFDSYVLLGPTDLQLNFTGTQVTTSTEWFDRVTIRLPAAWVISSATTTSGATAGGVGTNVATFSDSGYPCSGFGFNCGSGCTFVVHVNPNGVLTSQDLTWMIEGDTWNNTPDSVICSVGDPCDDYDACYADAGLDQTGADMVTGPVPVDLQTFEIN